jgi:hypothetical protein
MSATCEPLSLILVYADDIDPELMRTITPAKAAQCREKAFRDH